MTEGSNLARIVCRGYRDPGLGDSLSAWALLRWLSQRPPPRMQESRLARPVWHGTRTEDDKDKTQMQQIHKASAREPKSMEQITLECPDT